MKLTKILAIALAALSLTACSDDDFNTAGGVTVSMESAELKSRENATMIHVPIVVEGKANGPIQVTVEMSSPASGKPAAVEQKDYYVTSKTANIPAGVTSVSVQLYPVWERGIINDDIAFDVKIKSVKGASVGQLTSTEVILADADKDPYNIIQGQWNMYGESAFGTGLETFAVSITAPDEFLEDKSPNPEYGKVLYVKNYGGQDWLALPIQYRYNEDTKQIRLFVNLGTTIGKSTFTGLGEADVKIVSANGNSPLDSGVLNLLIDEDKNSITSENPSALFMSAVYSQNSFAGWFDGWSDLKFER